MSGKPDKLVTVSRPRPALVLSMVISAVGCALAGLCYAEFAAMVPIAGSAYTYAYATNGEFVAWIIGGDLMLEYALGVSTVAVGWSGYFVSFMRDLGIQIPAALTAPMGTTVTTATGATVPGVFNLPAACIVAIVATLLVIGIKESANTNAALVLIKSLVLCTVIYIAVAIVLTGIVSYTKLNVADPLAVGIDATGLHWLAPVVKVSALFGLFSTMLAQMLGQTRIFFSMATDGLLPRVFTRVHRRFRTPHVNTILTATVCALVSGFTPIAVLGELVSIGTLLAFVLVCLGVVILRRTAPEAVRPFRTPWVPWVPAIGGLMCLAQMIGLPLETWLRLLVWLVAGFAIYFLFGRRHAALVRGTRAGTPVQFPGAQLESGAVP
ncbi:MAG: amino acid permease [Gemmatimonadaceae bacterium]